MSRMAKGNHLSLEANQKAQIDDLVQRNRNLEHANKLLRDDINTGAANTKHQLSEAQAKFHAEQVEWRTAVKTLQSCHYISQLRIQLDFDAERLNVLREQENTRQEKIARIQRDFKLVEFQKKESELLARIATLEDDIVDLTTTHGEREDKFRRASADSLATIQELKRQLTLKDKEIDELARKLAAQLEATARHKAEHETLVPKLERSKLVSDDAVAKQTELQREIEDLKRAKSDMERQLEKWRSLENRGGEDMEKERKRRIELEAEVEALRAQHEKLTHKHKHKQAEYKKNIAEWEEHANSQEKDLDEANNATIEARNEATSLQRKVDKLKAELEKERAAKAQPLSPVASFSKLPTPTPLPKPKQRVKQPPPPPEDQGSDTVEEISPEPEPVPKARKKTKKARADSDIEEITPKSKGKGKQKAARDEEEEITEVLQEKPKRGPKGKARSREEEEEEEEDEVAESVKEVVPEKAKRGAKGKAKADDSAHGKGKSREQSVVEVTEVVKKGTKRTIDQVDSDIEEVPASSVVPSPPKARKRAPSKPPSASTAMGSKPSSRQKPPSASTAMGSRQKPPSASTIPASRQKPASRATSLAPSGTSNETEPSKKKRKINLFPTMANPGIFNFGGGTSTLDIPTVLSPVKESEQAPPRSMSAIRR